MLSTRPLSAALVGLLLTAASAEAQPVDCTMLPNPVYFPATTLVEQFLDRIAPKLAAPEAGDDQITVVYLPLASCNTYDYTVDGIAFEGTAIYWDATGAQQACDVAAGAGVQSHLSAMDVGGRTCRPNEAPPDDVSEFPAHVETIGFAVPRSSTQRAITATEGHYLLRYGAEAERQVPPWTQSQHIHIRHPGSSTQLTIGAAVGWSGTQFSALLANNSGSGDVFAKVAAENTTGNAEATIGILSSNWWDTERDSIRVLAFQGFNNCQGAFYPDSTSSSFDKRNVRDGHYPVWTNLRFVTRVDAQGVPVHPGARTLIEIATGVRALPGLNVAEAVVATGAIPTCAMHVTREFDGGPLAPFEHPAPCDCLFEELVEAGSSGCTACTAQADCGDAGVCRDGWCEQR